MLHTRFRLEEVILLQVIAVGLLVYLLDRLVAKFSNRYLEECIFLTQECK